MAKAAIVYWSGSGNTRAMADAVRKGAADAGLEVDFFACAQFDGAMMPNYDAIAFGCPAMGAEQLEESEFEPMFAACEAGLAGKKIALFGSFGWGDGEWMRAWASRCLGDGAVLACEPLTCNDAPDDAALAACAALGGSLA